MAKTKRELLSKAPWRGEEQDDSNKFADAKLKVTKQPGSTSKMHVPRRKDSKSKFDDNDDDSLEIDPELRYSFQRNFQFLQRVFSIDTVVKPLPPAMAYNVSRNLSFFTRIFTQFFEGHWRFYIRIALFAVLVFHYLCKSIETSITRLVSLLQDPEGIANAQKSLGLGQEEKARRVR